MLKEVKIELTNKCSRNCYHCSSRASNKNIIMLDYQDVIKVIREAADLGVKKIVFSGGEPLEYPYLTKLINLVNDLKMESTIYSFAYRTKDNIEKYRELLDLGSKKIVYSLADILSVNEFSSYEHEPFFDQVFQNFKDKYLGFHYALTKDSYPDFKKIIINTLETFKDKEYFDKLSILRFVSHGRGTQDMTLSKEELLTLKEFYLSLKNKDKVRLGSPWNILKIDYTPCIIADEVMIIGYDNIAYPCDSIKYNQKLGIGGNIKDNTLLEIYNSAYFQTLREAKDKGCNCFLCHGGCLGQKIINSKSNDLKLILKMKDPGCLND